MKRGKYDNKWAAPCTAPVITWRLISKWPLLQLRVLCRVNEPSLWLSEYILGPFSCKLRCR